MLMFLSHFEVVSDNYPDYPKQWFPTLLGLRHPAEENHNLGHPVAN